MPLQSNPPRQSLVARPARRAAAGLALCALAGLLASWQVWQKPMLSPALPEGIVYSGPLMLFGEPQAAPRLDAPADDATLQPAPPQKGMHITRPVWDDLSNEQKALLAGLEPIWPFISNAEKRRWLAIVRESSALDADSQQRLARNISSWGHFSEEQRMQLRQQYRSWNESDLLQLAQAWQDFNALDPSERTRLASAAQRAKRSPPQSRRAAPRRSSTLVRIPAASQTQPGLSNLPKIPIEPVRYTGKAAPAPASASNPAAVSQVTTVQAAPAQAPQQPEKPRVTYWHGIPITPPELPPLYLN